MKIVLFVSIAVLTCIGAIGTSEYYEQHTREIVATHNYEDTQFTITVKVYDDQKELNKAIGDVHDGITGATLKGLSVWEIRDEDLVLTDCTIYVMRPTTINDYKLKDWGHQLAHCAYGTYHQGADVRPAY